MIIEILPLFVKKIWGSEWAKEDLNFDCPKKTGEIFIASCINNFECLAIVDKQKISLNKYFKNNKEKIFKKNFDNFPLLIKIITANDNLSIQTHPNNFYAKKYEQSIGKNESWYILKLKNNNNQIIYGHNYKNLSNVKNAIEKLNWDGFKRKITIKENDFLDSPPGTVHAILGGTILYEIQQPSLITYRIYDYERMGFDGKKRELHTKKALDTLYFPQNNLWAKNYVNKTNELILLIKNDYYMVQKLILKEKFEFKSNEGVIITIIKGNAKDKISNTKLDLFKTYIINMNEKLFLEGDSTILISTPR